MSTFFHCKNEDNDEITTSTSTSNHCPFFNKRRDKWLQGAGPFVGKPETSSKDIGKEKCLIEIAF